MSSFPSPFDRPTRCPRTLYVFEAFLAKMCTPLNTYTESYVVVQNQQRTYSAGNRNKILILFTCAGWGVYKPFWQSLCNAQKEVS